MSSSTMHRLFGLGLVAVGLAFGWWGIWRPYQAALDHAPEARYSIRIFVLVPAALVFGLFFLLVGDSVPYRDAARQRFTAAGWLLMLAMALASGGSFWWMRAQFEALGYR